MQQQVSIWQFVLQSMQKQNGVMLLFVVESMGSSPGRAGFFMAVNNKGKMKGSIGGGIMEYKFVELALERLRLSVTECSLHKQVHNKSAVKHQSGMICSGQQTNLMYTVGQNDLEDIEKLILCLTNGVQAGIVLSPKGIKFKPGERAVNDGLTILNEHDWQYTQTIGYKHQLNIIGAGHCALALSALMKGLQFYIRLFDDRQNLNTYNENEHVHEKAIVQNYSSLENLIPAGPNVFVIIMTMGYRTDDIALRALQNKSVAYLGILGSNNKIEKMFAQYRQSGMSETWLKSLYAPAGLFIKSQTPEEIAVSIAAQIISIKNSV